MGDFFTRFFNFLVYNKRDYTKNINGDRRMRGGGESKYTLLGLGAVLLTLVVLAGCFWFFKYDGEKTASSTASSVKQEYTVSSVAQELLGDDLAEELLNLGGTLTVHYIDVGQGASALVECGGESMLIDAGGESMGTTVQLYLEKNGISSLKYLVASHPDADHIGGLDVIVTKYDVAEGAVWMPDTASDIKAFSELMDAIDYRGYKRECPAVGEVYYLGDAKVEILGPVAEHSDNNDNSLIIKVSLDDCSFLFTGDLTSLAEEELMATSDVSATVLTVAHHGSKSSTGLSFLDAVKPEYAVISVGRENGYGHPTDTVLNRLKNIGAKVFRTDEQGSVVASTDGSTITWNQAPSETWLSGDKLSEEVSE